MTDTLKPCPFCGGKSVVTKWFSVMANPRPDWWVASCVFGCGKSSEEQAEEFAVAAWNRRAREAAQLLERGSWKPSEEAVARIISYHARIAVTYDSVQRRYEHVSNADELARAILALSPDPAFLGEIEEASSPTRAASPASGLTATAPHSQSEKES